MENILDYQYSSWLMKCFQVYVNMNISLIFSLRMQRSFESTIYSHLRKQKYTILMVSYGVFLAEKLKKEVLDLYLSLRVYKFKKIREVEYKNKHA